MAQMMIPRIALISIKNSSRVIPRIFLPSKYQRSCFHTSWVLDVKGKEVLMPSLSPTMESGTIVKWLKKEGEKIEPGDALADIQTDKAIVTMEVDDESILAKIIVAEGTKDIKVGTLIALTVETDEDWKSVEIPDTVSAAPAAPSPAPTPAGAPPASAPAEPPPGQNNVTMPALSPTMTTGTIVKWLKKEGDEIEPGDALAEIQTDKAVMTFEFEDEAVFAKILAPEGTQVEVGQLIAITVEKGMDWKNVVISTTTKPSAAPAKGTGRPNRLLKSDVLAYIQVNNVKKVAPKTAPPPMVGDGKKAGAPSKAHVPTGGPSAYEDIPVSTIRGVIAKRLGESKSNIPHSYAFIDIKMDKLNEIRSELKADGINVSINDFITKAAAHALVECPFINTLYQNDQIIRMPKVDISIAVATESGLITPIVFDTAAKSVTDISTNIKALAEKAKTGGLKPEEFQGGTFTISNLGMFGIKQFCAIINPPQTAILAVGGGRDELDAALQKTTKMSATLSYDRRAIDEDQAADFLAVLRALLENPNFLVAGRIRALRYAQD
ncbi:PREDICTED: dihydrolipoyllysine-residue acetyltransferase component of pyruvate dehydrogenase complex, mitochondrial-like [Habropoda laboriosa]|uniref:dihydrolipoyllysine-residue acetyltransferase component of pyruvate dehydrogenase complex, mitochondrial-like n=1 Tax=Habropoda laboriosa TaxID=597456 RepID=UPI00083E542A|nr:PREDICTED: dihydrolipoyllysine-residue acetyltransferase component of pyruvate dehydrogenase complex, mitochondrial-like [Habropoda laboriosa]